jgi:alpha-galactosidase
MMGAFGYELDLTKVSEEDRKIMREQVQNYHRFAPIVQDGDFYRLLSPFESDFAAWMYVTPDQKQALVTLIIPRSKIRTTLFLRLRGLDPDAIYRDQHGNQYRGSVLLSAGFNFCGNFHGDGNSRMIYLEKIDS